MPTNKRFTEESFKKEPWFKALCSAIRSCHTEEDLGNLLRDIGTLSELQAWSERLEVARQLAKGLSYREVARVTGASTTTVTRVSKAIENGLGGYRKVLHVHRHHRIKVEPLNKLKTGDHIDEGKNIEVIQTADTQLTSGLNGNIHRPVDVLQKYLGKRG